jgi:hypothetical protein
MYVWHTHVGFRLLRLVPTSTFQENKYNIKHILTIHRLTAEYNNVRLMNASSMWVHVTKQSYKVHGKSSFFSGWIFYIVRLVQSASDGYLMSHQPVHLSICFFTRAIRQILMTLDNMSLQSCWANVILTLICK